jgi:integrase
MLQAANAQMGLPLGAGGGFVDALFTTAVVEQMLAAKRVAGRREVYVKNLRQVLTRFAAACPNLAATTAEQVEAWLASSKCPNSRQTNLNRVSTLFSFAVRRGYIISNPCERIERISIDRKPPVILTVPQSRDLLAACPTLLKPYLALGMFAGIRPDETMRMKWEDINFETATAKVDGKTRQRRIVPLEPIVVALLKDYPVKSGPVAPSNSTVRRWKRQAKALMGGQWKADVLRHTYASYALALYKDAGVVSTRMGNSSGILLAHYHEPVTEAACKLFWALPTHPQDGNQAAAQKEADPE